MSDKIIIKNDTQPEDENMTVTLSLESGDAECKILTIFECEGRDYIVLLPMDENGNTDDDNYWIYRYSEDPDDPNIEPVIDYIEDDDEYERVDDFFDEYRDERLFEDM